MFAMTSQDFQAAALAWVGTMVVVVPALIAGLTKVLPSIERLATQIEEIKARQDLQADRQNLQDRTVAQVALATPPPAATTPAPAAGSN